MPGPLGEWGIKDMRARILAMESDGGQISRIAETDVSGHRAVAASADGRISHVGKDDADASYVIGITTSAALAGLETNLVTIGEVTESSWNWAPGPVWLDVDGQLTQSVPVTGTLVRIGMATASTKLNVNPQVIVKF
jgi:hypothetical protein